MPPPSSESGSVIKYEIILRDTHTQTHTRAGAYLKTEARASRQTALTEA